MPEKVVNSYNYLVARRSQEKELTDSENCGSNAYGNHKVTIDDVRLINEYNDQTELFQAGRPMTIEIDITAHDAVPDITLGILFRDRFGQDIYGTNSWEQGFPIHPPRGQTFCLTYYFKALNMGYGKYSATLAVHTGREHTQECFEWRDKCRGFEVVAEVDNYFIGLCRLQPTLSLQQKSSQKTAANQGDHSPLL